MANRSYLYACNVIPLKSSTPDSLRIKGITEYNYDVPAITTAFIGSKFIKFAPSTIWVEPGAICSVSDFKSGYDLYIEYATRVADLKLNNFNHDELSRQKQFLERNKARFAIAELGELAVMQARSNDGWNEIGKIVQRMTKVVIKDANYMRKAVRLKDQKFVKFVNKFRDRFQMDVSLDNVLYYS
jgi:hypothetical protein